MRLLCAQWSEGSLPDDDVELSSYGRGDTSLTRVRLKFKKGEDGRLRNDRMEHERAKQTAYREKQAENGQKGGRPRNPSLTQAFSLNNPAGNPNKSSPSPSPSPSPKEEREEAHAHFPEAEIPSWKEFWEFCKSLQCGLAAEWYARDKFQAADSDHWKGKSNWRAYALRCKGWWEADGRPMEPTKKNGKPVKQQNQEPGGNF